MLETLKILVDQRVIRELDYQVARVVARCYPLISSELLQLVVESSAAVGRGCVRLSLNTESRPFELDENNALLERLWTHDHLRNLLDSGRLWMPGVLHRAAALEEPSVLVSEAGGIYLRRYFIYEKLVIEHLARRLTDKGREEPEDFPDVLQLASQGLTGNLADVEMAIRLACLGRLLVVSGGPGAGKTTIVSRLLVGFLLTMLKVNIEHRPIMYLAAPTGKAAERMRAALFSSLATMSLPDGVREMLPIQASTIHRLLGIRAEGGGVRYHRRNPLTVDLVVVDEASMVDLPLFHKLLEALPENATLVLVGDRHQLSSVEPGGVLSDLCDTLEEQGNEGKKGRVPSPNKRPCALVHLETSYRFSLTSPVAALSTKIRSGKAKWGERIVAEEQPEPCESLAGGDGYSASQIVFIERKHQALEQLKEIVVKGYRPYLESLRRGETGEKLLADLRQFRILVAVREGASGLFEVNRLVRSMLASEGLIEPARKWYRGRQILVTANDYQARLFNGDLGICLGAAGDAQVLFSAAGISSNEGSSGCRLVSSRVLENAEDAFAMTVHKSQGSEFADVVFILPEKVSPVVTRELIYTAVTRAQSRVYIVGTPTVFNDAVLRRADNSTGLREKLRMALDNEQ